jgi:acyl-CoA synthetase (AMP-forming)/AMP-acid ligase II
MMKGYLNRPDATAEIITVDGWLKTGDVGYADERGYFYIVDRLKELIKYKGYQVPPAELEDILITHPAVVDAAVIARPDEAAGEIPVAYIVRAGEITPEEIVAHVARQVAPYKQIRDVVFVDAIPRNPTGKILRRLLLERERGLVPA